MELLMYYCHEGKKNFEAMSELMAIRFRKRSDRYQLIRYLQAYYFTLTVLLLILLLTYLK